MNDNIIIINYDDDEIYYVYSYVYKKCVFFYLFDGLKIKEV